MRHLTPLSSTRVDGSQVPASALVPLPDPIDIEPLEGSDGDAARERWELVKRNRGKLSLALVLGALAGFLISLPQTPIYRARTSIEIEAANENYLNLRDVSPTEGGASATELDIATHVKVLKSRSLLAAVVADLGLENRKEFQSTAGGWRDWLRRVGVETRTLSPVERAQAAAAENVRISASHQTRIVEVVSEWDDPELAAAFANALAEAYIERSLEARWQTTQRTGAWLSRQLEDLRVKLESSAATLQNYAAASGLMFTSEKESVAQERLRQVQQELSRAQAERIKSQSRYELFHDVPPTAWPELPASAELDKQRGEAAGLRRELAELGAEFTDDYWKVRRVEAQLGALEHSIEAETASAVERARNGLEASRERERLLGERYREQARLVSAQSEREIRYRILKGEVEADRELYNGLLQKVKEAGVAAAMQVSTIRVVDPALRPRFPSRPNHFLNSLLGMLAGGLVGVGLLLVGERFDSTIKQPGDAARLLRVHELGSIPVASQPALGRGPGEAEGEDSADLVERIAGGKDAVLTEHFRAAATSILFAAPARQAAPAIVVTSPSPGEGKTTVAASIAASLAEVKGRVLLIDADMRKPRVHSVFGLSNRRGLTDVLRGAIRVDALETEGLIRETNVPGLHVLTSGPPFYRIPNLLHSEALRELLAAAEEAFDAVVIDTPPMLQIADARVLGQLADGVILVLRAGRTSHVCARAASERLREDGACVLGSILNGWNPKTSAHGYYGEYQRYSSYYSSPPEEPEHA